MSDAWAALIAGRAFIPLFGFGMTADKAKSRPRVYLVEDSPIILNLLVELIETTKATIVGHADNAPAAIADIAALHPDVVTVDIRLRAGTGFDVLEGIAINHDGKPPVRIVLTNYVTDAYRNAARRLGVDYFFDKARQIREVLGVLDSLGAKDDGAERSATGALTRAGPALC